MEINKIYNEDCLETVVRMPDNSIDSVVTDPPYGLEFMGKEWDKFTGSDTGIMAKPTSVLSEKGFDNLPIFRGMSSEQRKSFYSFSYQWAKECLRVLKPGGFLLAFGGSRTYHRMACAIEDAGFEIRDQIMWVYGSGFPKSLNIGKAVDKLQGNEREVVGKGFGTSLVNQNKLNVEQGFRPNDYYNENVGEFTITKGTSEWEGWGTALKPAHEPIVLARKPLSEKTVAENVLKWGVGGINIDACRIKYIGKTDPRTFGGKWKTDKAAQNVYEGGYAGENQEVSPLGRFPANFVHDGSEEVLELFPNTKAGIAVRHNSGGNTFGGNNPKPPMDDIGYNDSGSAARFFYCAKASSKERNSGLEEMPDKPAFDYGSIKKSVGRHGENTPRKNHHPTVKPINLMCYLIKLVTPKKGVVLDPFLGSGTTALACIDCGNNFIGIEQNKEYFEISKARIERRNNGKENQ